MKLIDLTNETFGSWKVIKRGTDLNQKPTWICKCACGVEKEVLSRSLRRGSSTSCGCSKAIDMTGIKMGRLLILNRSGSLVNSLGEKEAALWNCKCDCGKETVVSGNDLRSGHTKSCGCLQRDTAASSKTTSGQYLAGEMSPARSEDLRTWRSWISMLRRCYSSYSNRYKYYGERGITVCDRWNPQKGGTFLNFLSDMGTRPIDKTLDRKNVNSNYEKSNCRWATNKEQANNKRKST